MTVPTPKTWTAAETVDAPEGNTEWRDVLNYLLSPPHALAFRTADKSTTDAVTTVYDMDAESYDSHGAHSTSSNNSRLIAPETGLYAVKCQAKWAADADGSRRLQIRKNAAGSAVGGTLVFDTASLPSSGNIGFANGTVDVILNATDYIEMFTQHTAGNALNVIGGVGESYLSMRWVSKS